MRWCYRRPRTGRWRAAARRLVLSACQVCQRAQGEGSAQAASLSLRVHTHHIDLAGGGQLALLLTGRNLRPGECRNGGVIIHLGGDEETFGTEPGGAGALAQIGKGELALLRVVRKRCGIHAQPGELVRAGEGAHPQVLRQSARVGAFHELFAGLSVQRQNHLVQHAHRLEAVQGSERVGGAFNAGVGGAAVNPESVSYGVFTQLTDGVVEECAAGASSAVFGGDGCLNYTGIFVVCRG